MAGGAIEVDYLVIGAGATGLAFTDALIAESDATVLMVDRRHSPGGHWNDAYPFVRLHQPSAFYGVNSRTLGDDRIDDTGPNAGFYERATAAEICHYYQAVMREHLLPSGQVEFLPMTDVIERDPSTASVVSRLTGVERDVVVRRKVVDARFLESSIPATHTRGYTVDEGVHCVPVNDLVRSGHPTDGYVVIGAGKTGMDACCWLLDNGVDPDGIIWVKPRDAWVNSRGSLQPLEKIGDFITGWAAATEACALATTVPDLLGRLEDAAQLKRVDTSVDPTMYRAAIMSDAELEQLRSIEHVVRSGRVRRIHKDRISLDDAEVSATPDRLYIDCTADGLPRPGTRPVFDPKRITIQTMREGSPPFNAALTAYLEATRDDVAEQNALCPVNTYPTVAADWIRNRYVGLIGQRIWDQTNDVRDWIEGSRLNIARGLFDHASDPRVGAAIGSYIEHFERAVDNLGALRVSLGDDLTRIGAPDQART